MKTIILVTTSLFLVSCAATQTTQNDEPREQRTFKTGSNLPVRDNSVPAVQSESAKIINSAPPAYIPGKGGAN